MKSKSHWQPKVQEHDGLYSVQSETAAGIFYTVDLRVSACNCPGSQYRPGRECKHIQAAREFASAKAPERRAESPKIIETPEQTEFLSKILEGAERIAALRGKADGLDCYVLAGVLSNVARQLTDAVDEQRQAIAAVDPFEIIVP